MKNVSMFAASFLLSLLTIDFACGQSAELQRWVGSVPKIPVDEAINRTLASTSLTSGGSPFHAVLEVSQPRDTKSPYQGTIEIFWAGPAKYRLILKAKGFQQTRIVNGDAVEETNTGDFYPEWLRNYVRALMDPLPMAHFFAGQKTPVNLGANITQSCVKRDDRTGGITDMMTWANICFQGAEPRIDYAMDFTYFMEFGEYKSFGKKLIARTYTTYTDGNDKVIGKLKKLESMESADEKLFTVANPTPPGGQIETRFVSMATNVSLLEKAPVIKWPPIHEGKTEGNMIVHVVTDRTGQVREANKHNSDTPAVEDFGVQQALKYKFKPLLVNDVPVQMETPLVLHFSTKIGDALPVITGDDIAMYASGCNYHPILPVGLLPSGTTFKIRVSVNEQGKNTGESFPQNVPWEVVQKAGLEPMHCTFKPYLVNGQPWYHHIDFVFTAP